MSDAKNMLNKIRTNWRNIIKNTVNLKNKLVKKEKNINKKRKKQLYDIMLHMIKIEDIVIQYLG